jgi:hypothetical protein
MNPELGVVDGEASDASVDTSALFRQGIGLMQQGRHGDAEQSFLRVLEADPDHVDTLRHYSGLCSMYGVLGRSAGMLEHAVEVATDCADAWRMLGATYQGLGREVDAGVAFRKANLLAPLAPNTLWGLALHCLKTGDWTTGWNLYRWGRVVGARRYRTLQEPWDGIRDLRDKTLLVWSEWGQGDGIMMMRFVKILKYHFPRTRIVVEQHPALMGLFSDWPCIDFQYPQTEDASIPIPFDEHISLLDLPGVLCLTIDDLERNRCGMADAYVRPDPEAVARWASWMRDKGYLDDVGQMLVDDAIARMVDPDYETFHRPPNLRPSVGVCWMGNPTHPNDRHRSVPGDLIQAWCEGLKGVRAVPLHPEVLPVQGWDETAAIVANLDLVVTVDTAVAHLAGAMGKPVWILLPANSDFRWLMDRDDSPWYPSARLYRQTTLANWEAVLDRVGDDLARWRDQGRERLVAHVTDEPVEA